MTAEQQLSLALFLNDFVPCASPLDEYTLLVAESFERFVDECFVLVDDPAERSFRLYLCELAFGVLLARCGDLRLVPQLAGRPERRALVRASGLLGGVGVCR